MTNPEHAFQPAIDALERDLVELERQGGALLASINLLRGKAGLPPRPGGGGFTGRHEEGEPAGGSSSVKIHSDSFTGKKLQSAVREYLEMRKASGGDAPATSREIFDALKEGGYSSGAKDDATGLVVLRTLLRKSNVVFVKLHNGKYGLRSWYPNLKPQKQDAASKSNTASDDSEDKAETAADKAAAA